MRLIRTTCVLLVGLLTLPAVGEVLVQDVARLQGQRINKIMGYGLVVGLNGTGDGEKYLPTMRALMRLQQRYHAPVLTDADLKGNNSVALVAVEATIPENGSREGQAVDVVVSVIGSCQSLKGGQLLTTPLQYAMFDEKDPATQYIMALAGGQVELPNSESQTRGVIHGGAVLEQDFFYNFIDDDCITLVLEDTHAGWTWSHMVARAINHELTNPGTSQASARPGQQVVDTPPAVALGPKNISVRIPSYELANPANFISRVLQTRLFMLPRQQARVIINRTTGNVAFTGTVTVSPTILQIPRVGTVLIGKQSEQDVGANEEVGFDELLETLSAIKVTPDQLIDAIEHLHKTGTLHAQLQYE